MRRICLLIVVFGMLALPARPALAASPADPLAPPAVVGPGRLYVGETGHMIGGGFLALWASGGAGVFGYPLTEEFDDVCAGRLCTVQYFERARFEYDPASGAVSLGLLGREHLGERGFPREAPCESTADRWCFPETGQTLAYGFLSYWVSHDGPRRLGLPLSPELTEDGRTAQYFERGRLEYYPERPAAESVQVAPLGRALVERRGWTLPATVELALSSVVVPQGRPLAVAARGASAVTATLDGQPLEMSQSGGVWRGVAGIAPWADLGARRLVVEATAADGSARRLERLIQVVHYDFPQERIIVPPGQSDLLSPEVRERELAVVNELYGIVTPGPLWQGAWIWPTTGRVTTEFATRRAYNDGPFTEYHGGVDLAAPEGAPVLATAAGRVVYAGPLAIRGNFVAIDHGLGVLSTYFHMSALTVRAGETVAQGQLIGRVGSTGLSTGPHLHWEARIMGTPVDPRSWLESALLP